MKKFQKLFIILFATVLVFTACGNNTAKADKTLNLAVSSELITLDSLTVSNADSAQLIANFIEGLTTYSAEGKIIGAIAKDWQISEDGLTYTFNLRDDATWQNGVPVTAQDFVFAWQKVLTLPTAAYKGHLRNFVNGPAIAKGEKTADTLGAKALSDTQLQITLTQPTPYLLDLLAFPSFLPVNEAFYNEVGAEKYGTTKEAVLANSAFTLEEYAGDTGYVLKKNETYWDKANVDLAEINVRVVKQADTRASLYEAGEIDQLILTSDLHDKYANDKDLVVETQPRMNFLYLSKNIHPETSILVNDNLRKAVAYAIDKELIVDTIVKDGSVAADYFLPRDLVSLDGKDFRDYSGNYNTLSYDVAKAQEFFAQAKAELGDKDLTFEISLSDTEAATKAFESIKAQLETNLSGLKIKLNSLPAASYTATLKENRTPAANTGWVAGIKDPSTFFEIYQTGQVQNYGLYSNLQFDKLMKQTESAELALDANKRWDTYVEAEKVLLEDYYVIPLYQKGQESLINPQVKGLKLSPTIPAVFYKYITVE